MCRHMPGRIATANRDSVGNDYDAFAEAYTAANEDGLINALTMLGRRFWTSPGM
ncbi:hypothetical protein GCM10009675_04530 [Prauserella alba]|uniref:Uncharacterized protein n=1 Tax=Prauserella alba TaxID=176898 RepID=A0ABP4FSD2_9PSEU